MAKRTSKTSHVLNLITNGEPDMPAEAPKPAAQPESNTAKASESKVTVVDTEEERSQVSEEVQKQLLSQLEGEAAVLEEPAAEEVSAAQANTVQEPAVQEALEAAEKPAEPVAEAPVEAEHIPEEKTTEEPTHMEKQEKTPEITYDRVNVMEKLLERTDVMKQMKEYGVCTCSRCHADVCALVLTRLPAKYVVAENTAVSPMISYYEAKYRMRILTEMIKSCIDVRDNPRH